MRNYVCTCGGTIYFDNTICLKCSSELGFCPGCRTLTALVATADGGLVCGRAECGIALVKCFNYSEFQVCNRCVAAEGAAAGALCDCCRFNETIPDLTVPGNQVKWYALEAAKRRLFYDLSELGLPYGTAADGIEPSLCFDFKADVIPKGNYWRNSGLEQTVYTGHDAGRITINIREADDVEREKLRVVLNEAHRTLIGHFRHEIGHFYWDALVKGRPEREAECVNTFGDHNEPTYAAALEAYYKNGPKPAWQETHVSAYATMHAWEDFAETWATYLDMTSTLDTAEHVGFGGVTSPTSADFDQMISRYQAFGLAANEINRNLGLLNLVPEVFAPPVVEKLRYIHKLVKQGRADNPIFQTAGTTQQPTCEVASPVHESPQLASANPQAAAV
jgi:hypothetical protein